MKKIVIMLFLFVLTSFASKVWAQSNGPLIRVTSDVSYQYIGTYDVAKLNTILNKEVPEIIETKINYSAPKNAVKLYRVEYKSVVPEQNNRPTLASGLIAIPATGAKRMPMVSYQHGTIYGDMGVPSTPDNSWETQLMIAQFASQGYIVIGADYFGLGISKEKDSYIVLNSQIQASYDMYEAAKNIIAKEGISISDFFISGWSQGGVITMAFLERLEEYGVKVKAAGTAAAQCDGFVMVNGFLSHPREIDANWVTTMFILTAFSFEEYYQIPGLAKGVFTDEQYETAKRVYMKDTTLEFKDFPLDLRKLIRPEYFDPAYFKKSAYGKLLQEMHPYRWDIKTPVHMYYGDIDQCLTIDLARLPYNWQKAIGNDKLEVFSVGPDATHRITYGRAVSEWKKWFDEMNLKK
jgi:pimeloyl-ACP methyl ester carboxylesterase